MSHQRTSKFATTVQNRSKLKSLPLTISCGFGTVLNRTEIKKKQKILIDLKLRGAFIVERDMKSYKELKIEHVTLCII